MAWKHTHKDGPPLSPSCASKHKLQITHLWNHQNVREDDGGIEWEASQWLKYKRKEEETELSLRMGSIGQETLVCVLLHADLQGEFTTQLWGTARHEEVHGSPGLPEFLKTHKHTQSMLKFEMKSANTI